MQTDSDTRIATVERKTKETNVFVSLDLDGNGEYDVDTGIGFLDHMLEQLSRHSLIDLKVRAQGRPAHRFPPHDRRYRHRDRRGRAQGAGRLQGYPPLRDRHHSDGRDLHPRLYRRVAASLSHLEGRFHEAEARRHGHGTLQGVVPRPYAQNAGITLHIENMYGATIITSSKAASRVSPGRCAMRSRSTRAPRTAFPRPRACWGTDFRFPPSARLAFLHRLS